MSKTYDGMSGGNLIRRLLEWQGGLCGICCRPASPSQCNKDHVHPRHPSNEWMPGHDNLSNIMAAHRECNSAKGNCIPSADYIKRLEQRNRLIGLPAPNLPALRRGRPHPINYIYWSEAKKMLRRMPKPKGPKNNRIRYRPVGDSYITSFTKGNLL